MNPSPFPPMLARHLRFHRHLLELWRHTANPPELAQPEDWTPWLSKRQHLLDALAACDGPHLAADTHALLCIATQRRDLLRASGDHPLAPMLRALQARELAMMQSLLALESMLRRALVGRRLALARRLLSAQRASAACKSYRRGRVQGSHPDSDVTS